MDIVVPRTAAIQAELIALVKKAFGKTLKKVEGLMERGRRRPSGEL